MPWTTLMADPSIVYTFDVKGLLAFATSSGNQFAVAQADIQSGTVVIFSAAWNEFCEAYEDESITVAGLDIERKPLTDEHRASIVAIADRANATFGRKGPNDSGVGLEDRRCSFLR
jgi:predicted transglutaminase-like cysteine proteinase